MAPGRGTQPPANLAGIVTLDCPNAAAVIVGEEERNCGCLTVGVARARAVFSGSKFRFVYECIALTVADGTRARLLSFWSQSPREQIPRRYGKLAIHLAEQGSGFQRDVSEAFLKWELTTQVSLRYCGSRISDMSVIH